MKSPKAVNVMSTVIGYLRDELPNMLAVCLIQILATSLSLLSPWPLKLIVDGVFSKSLVDGTEFAKGFVHNTLGWASRDGQIAILCVLMAVITILGGILGYVSSKLAIKGGLRAVLRFRADLFESLQYAPLLDVESSHSTESTYRIAYDSQSLQTIYNGVFIPLLSSGLTLLGAIIIMLKLSAPLTFVALVVIPPVFFALRFGSSSIEEYSRKSAESESQLLKNAQEVLGSQRYVRAHSMEYEEIARFRESAASTLKATYKLNKLQMKSGQAVNLVVATGTSVLYFVGFIQITNGALSLGSVLVFVNYLAQLYGPVQYLSGVYVTFSAAKASISRCCDLLKTETVMPEIVNDRAKPDIIIVRGGLSIRNLSFGYSINNTVLDLIDLDILPGENLAIVGPSGEGKSTLLGLICGFYHPRSGAILVDNNDLSQVNCLSLRKQISLVLQDAILFSGTVADNIRYGRGNTSNFEVEQAAVSAEADSFIRELPLGYQTVIGEGGVKLSGGQRQRLSLARAFLRNSPLLLLDEPTSSLDSVTESRILRSIFRLAKGRTTLIVTHRLALADQADRVAVIRDKKIVEIGDPKYLATINGYYSELKRASLT